MTYKLIKHQLVVGKNISASKPAKALKFGIKQIAGQQHIELLGRMMS